jgi:ParB family chromosome partitioning protein
MEDAAQSIAAEQSFRQSGDETPISGAEVVARLIKAATVRQGRSQKSVIEAAGVVLGQVDKDRARGLTITLNPTELSAAEVLEALRPFIEAAKILKKTS